MLFIGALVIFILLFCLMLIFYKYLFDIVKYFNLNKKKYVKYIVLIISILLFYGSLVFMYMSKIGSVLGIFIIYTILISLIIYFVNIFLKKYKLWNKIYLFIPIIFSLIYTIYGIYNMTDIRVKEYNLKSDKLNNNYKIGLIADLHYGVSLKDNDLIKVCDEISKKDLDLIVLAGDIVDERTTKSQMKNAFKILGNIKTKYGVFYMYGNHDKNNYSRNKLYTTLELNDEIEKNNIKILEEENILLNNDLTLIGRGYEVRKDINELLNDVDKSTYVVLVDHIPQEYKNYKDNGINLELSGHTHAGQIFPLGLIQKTFNLNELVYGIKENDSFTGIVTSGIAGWAIPIRTEKHSEYVVVNLKSNVN